MEEKNNEDMKNFIKKNRPQMERKATIDTLRSIYKVPKTTAYSLYKKALKDEKIPFS